MQVGQEDGLRAYAVMMTGAIFLTASEGLARNPGVCAGRWEALRNAVHSFAEVRVPPARPADAAADHTDGESAGQHEDDNDDGDDDENVTTRTSRPRI